MNILRNIVLLGMVAVSTAEAVVTKTVGINPYTGQGIINEPGRYVLQGDLTVSPRSRSEAMLYIGASDVILDMNGKTLKISSTSNSGTRAGIEIATGSSNITIMNGKIDGTGAFSTAATVTGIFGRRTSNVTVDRVTVQNLGTGSLTLPSSSLPVIPRSIHFEDDLKTTIKRCKTSGSAIGLFLRGSSNAVVTDTTIDNVLTGTGVVAQNSTQAALSKISVTNGSGAVIGFDLTNCTAFNVSNCKVQNALGAGFKCGYYLTGCRNNNFTQCDFNNNTSTSGKITGFQLNNIFNNKNVFDRCNVKSNNDNANSVSIFGFENRDAQHNRFDGCAMLDNTSSATVRGFFASSASGVTNDGVYIQSCRVINNKCGSSTGGAYGIVFNGVQGGVIDNCEISNNGIDYLGDSTCISASGNGSEAIGICLQNTCATLRITNNIIAGNAGAHAQLGLTDNGTANTLSGAAATTSTPAIIYGNSSLLHGAQDVTGASLKANFRAVLWTLWGADFADAAAAITPSEIVLGTPTAAGPFTSLDPLLNISIYTRDATGLTD